MILYFNFLPSLLRNKIHINSELRFDPFLEDLTPWTSQNDLLANNCQKKIDPACPACPVAPGDGTGVGRNYRTEIKFLPR